MFSFLRFSRRRMYLLPREEDQRRSYICLFSIFFSGSHEEECTSSQGKKTTKEEVTSVSFQFFSQVLKKKNVPPPEEEEGRKYSIQDQPLWLKGCIPSRVGPATRDGHSVPIQGMRMTSNFWPSPTRSCSITSPGPLLRSGASPRSITSPGPLLRSGASPRVHGYVVPSRMPWRKLMLWQPRSSVCRFFDTPKQNFSWFEVALGPARWVSQLLQCRQLQPSKLR
eukprot:jgi/Botrbrau1/6463/Bobra.0034s0038.1